MVRTVLLLSTRFFLSPVKGYIKFFNYFTIISLSLSVGAVITVLAFMNGVEHEFSKNILNKYPHLMLEYDKEDAEKANVLMQKHALEYLGYTKGFGLIKQSDKYVPGLIYALDEEKINELITDSSENTIYTSFSTAFSNNLIKGEVEVIAPKVKTNMFGIQVQSINSLIKAVNLPYTHMWQKNSFIAPITLVEDILAGKSHGAFVTLYEPFMAKVLQQKLQAEGIRAISWQDILAPIVEGIKVEKSLITLVLFIIIIIGVLNLFVAMHMMVHTKAKDIASLMLMGKSKWLIFCVFFLLGVFTGTFSIALGIAFALILTSHTGAVLQFIFWLLGIKDLVLSTYKINNFPVLLLYEDIVFVGIAAFALILLAAILPAYATTKSKLINQIRY